MGGLEEIQLKEVKEIPGAYSERVEELRNLAKSQYDWVPKTKKEDGALLGARSKDFEQVEDMKKQYVAIRGVLAVLNQTTAQVKALRDQEDDFDSKSALSQLNNITAPASAKARQARAKLKEIKASDQIVLKKMEDAKQEASVAYCMRKNMYDYYTRSFYNAFKSYQAACSAMKQHLDETSKRRLKIVLSGNGQDWSDEKLDEIIASNQQAKVMQAALVDGHELEEELERINEQHKGILELERRVREIAIMFKEVHALVMQQGETLDNITHFIEESMDYVEQAEKEFLQAERHQKSARKKMICCAIVFGIALIILFFVLKSMGVFDG